MLVVRIVSQLSTAGPRTRTRTESMRVRLRVPAVRSFRDLLVRLSALHVARYNEEKKSSGSSRPASAVGMSTKGEVELRTSDFPARTAHRNMSVELERNHKI